jgi:hypothetical protein
LTATGQALCRGVDTPFENDYYALVRHIDIYNFKVFNVNIFFRLGGAFTVPSIWNTAVTSLG